MRHIILATSHSPASRSSTLAKTLEERIAALGDDVELVRLRELDLPFCDGGASYEDPAVQALHARIDAADVIAVATPIYNFETGGATRNLVALTGSAWRGKPVAFLCAAGGRSSYMAVMPLASSLMLDFRCVIVPQFVFASDEDFQDDRLISDDVAERIGKLAEELQRMSRALRGA